MSEQFTPPPHLAKRLVRSWLRCVLPRLGAHQWQTYAYHHGGAHGIAEIPEGHYAVVKVEVRPLADMEPLPETWVEERV